MEKDSGEYTIIKNNNKYSVLRPDKSIIVTVNDKVTAVETCNELNRLLLDNHYWVSIVAALKGLFLEEGVVTESQFDKLLTG